MVLHKEVERRRFSVGEYHRMGEAGIFHDGDRVELIGGEIIEMTPIGSRHAACVNKINHFLVGFAGRDYVVSPQNPILLDEKNELQPDFALLKHRDDFYAGSLPVPDEVSLIIEVSDTSLSYDREVKLPLYARSGIPEVWIVDLTNNMIVVYSRPQEGSYSVARKFTHGDKLTSESIENLSLSASEIF